MAANLAPTFKTGTGKVTTDFGGIEFGQSLFIQADGKILVAGSTDAVFGGDFALVRYNKDGSLDASFGNQGKLTVDFLGREYGYSVVQQPDGKILITGMSDGASLNVVTARLNADGTLDTSFDADGKFNAFNGSTAYGGVAAFQLDGKLLIAGANAYSQIALQRLNADGTIDSSFGVDGQINSSVFGNPSAISSQPDGKVVVLANAGDGKYVVARYNADGTEDTSFNSTGFLKSNISPNPTNGYKLDYGNGLAIQADGKIVVAGHSLISGSYDQYDFAVARYNSNGSLDATFNGDGIAIFSISTSADYVSSITIQADGKLLVAGYSYSFDKNQYDFSLVRLNTNGTLDTSFSGDGIVTTSLTNANDWAYSVTVQADGKILVAGEAGFDNHTSDFALVRYNADGSLDTHFNPTIDTLNSTLNYIENASPILLDNSVEVYDAELSALNGGSGNYSGASVTLSRQDGANAHDTFSGIGNLSFIGTNVLLSGVNIGSLTNSNGTLAITFNANATQAKVNEALSSIDYSNTSDTPPVSVQINWTLNDHNAGAQGTGGELSTVGSTAINIAAVNDAPTFANLGKVTNGFDGTTFNYAKSVITQVDGKIILAGYSYDGDHSDQFELVRYNQNGTLDTSFSGDGKVATPNISATGDFIYDSVLQADGKIVVVGRAYTGGLNLDGQPTTDFILLRYNTDGSQDLSFGNNGKVTTDFGLLEDDNASSVSVQSDGKLLVAGSSWNGSTHDFALARYNSNGLLDDSFGLDGKLITDINLQNEFGSGAFIQPDGKIVVAGSSTTYYPSGPVFNNFGLVRYNADGTLDPTFGSGGKAATQMVINATDIGMQADGKFIIAGTAYSNSIDFALTRYNSNGTLDTTFGVNGQVFTDISNLGVDNGSKVAIQADGKIILVGISVNDFAVVRYNIDGSLDSSFGNGGKVTTDFNGGFDTGFSVTIQSDGKILVAGDSYDLSGNKRDFALVRYNIDGSIDSQFNSQNSQSSLDGTSLFSFFENGPAVLLERNVQVYDAELSALNNFSGSSITLARQGGANTQDIFSGSGNLIFNGNSAQLSGTVIGSVSNTNGTLLITFNSNATQVRVNEALSSITYSNSSDAPPASVQINWTFNDGNTGAQGAGGALSTLASTTVNITAVNDAPFLSGSKAILPNGTVDSSYTITKAQLLMGYADADGDVMSISNVTADHGTVINNNNGSYSIIPADSYIGLMNLSYIVNDGHGADVMATQNFNVNAVNDNPPVDPPPVDHPPGNYPPAIVTSSFLSLDDIEAAMSKFAVLDSYSASFEQSLNELAAFGDGAFYITGVSTTRINAEFYNGDTLSIFGSFSNFPASISSIRFNLESAHTVFSISGSATLANENADFVGNFNKFIIQDTLVGSKVTIGANYNVTRDIVTSIKSLQVELDGVTLLIKGSFLEDNSALGIAGTISSVSLSSGSSNITVSGMQMSYALFETYNTYSDFLTDALSADDSVTGTSASQALYGYGGNDKLFGLSGNDTLEGGDGNDTLDGGVGTDTLFGGSGDDTYLVDTLKDANNVVLQDTIVDSSGNDTLKLRGALTLTVPATLTLSNDLENLDASATAGTKLNLTGNAEANILTGNVAANVLSGLVGNDTLIGGAGADTLIGGDGNDSLDGGTGSDSMDGGEGDDTYIVDAAGDVVIDVSGTDTVKSSITYTLGADLENLILTGKSAINGIGNSLTNYIEGNDGNNILDSGTAGDDTLKGGKGNDTYIVQHGDVMIEELLAGGTDLVKSSIAYVLDGNIENLILTGLDNINGTGNTLANVITGNAGNNVLDGGGGTAVDKLMGGAGDDTYRVDLVSSGAGSKNVVKMKDVITEAAKLGGDDTVKLRGEVLLDSAGQSITKVATIILAATLENLDATGTGSTLLNLTGNNADNDISGNEANNLILGGAGLDRLFGNLGNDTLDGGAGVDALDGGQGDDTYIVNIKAGDGTNGIEDVITESGAGNDTLKIIGNLKLTQATSFELNSIVFTEFNNFENLDVSGTGKTLINLVGSDVANILTGNAAANIIDGLDGDDALFGGAGNDTLSGGDGEDTLDGGAGADSMVGGSGRDTYYVDNINDIVVESADADFDTVYSSLKSYTLADNIETLILKSAAVTGIGNSENNFIFGTDGANTLFGMDGNDSIDANKGNDIVYGGFGDDTISGDAGNDKLFGDDGDDRIFGGSGNDTLTGGAGADTFVFTFTEALPSFIGNIDTITDFQHGVDKIELNPYLFESFNDASFQDGVLDADNFHAGKTAETTSQFILYDDSTGKLYYDADGSGVGKAIQFAVLSKVDGAFPDLVAGDFNINFG